MHDFLLISISFLVGVFVTALLYKEEASVYDRLVAAIQVGEAEFMVEVGRIKSELTKLHL